MTPTKYLCVCRRGNVRSAGLAYRLKELHGLAAIAVGFETCGAEAMEILCNWADRIVVVRESFRPVIPPGYAAKVRVIEIGPDVFHNPMNPELQDKITLLLGPVIAPD